MNYIIVYLEIKHLLNFLSQSEKGDFLDLLICYGETQEIPIIENKSVLNVFNFIKDRLDKQIEKSKVKANVARNNGAKGGRPRETKKPMTNPEKPRKTQSVKSQDLKYQDLVNGLKFVLEAKLNKTINSGKWHEEIRKLIEIDLKNRPDAQEDIRKAIQAISDNYNTQYFPVIQSASSLREKFTKIEDFLSRKESNKINNSRIKF